MNIIEGNLIELAKNGTFDVIIHGCNCQCRMGSGIAKQIKEAFPEAFIADRTTTPGDIKKLGNYTVARPKKYPHLYVLNAYTQFYYGRDPNTRYADYSAIELVFRKIAKEFHGKKIGYPAIGAGLARGNWHYIAALIDKNLKGEDHTFVRYKE